MDYSSALVQALEYAKCKTSGLNKPGLQHAINAVNNLAKTGPITAKNALLISTLFPNAVNFASTPLLELEASKAGMGPSPLDLAPKINQGMQSWYWNLTNFNASSGVLFVIKQTTINAATGLSIWSVDAGAVDPATNKWVSPDTVYLDSNLVTVTSNGVKILPNPQIAGAVSVSPQGFSINIQYTTGFSFAVTSTSARGPTYEQSGGNVKRIGPLQNGYWSIVDGNITTGSLQLTKGGKVYTYGASSGMSWLDYQQFGIKGITYIDQFLATAIKTKPAPMKWMFLVVQTPKFQLDAYILNPGSLSKLNAGKAVKGRKTVNLWQGTAPAQYDLDCIVQVLEVYPGSADAVPSKVSLQVLAPLNMTFILTSITTTVPSLITAGGSGYESPSTVTVSGSQVGTGVIEWVPGDMYPTQQDVLTETNISREILKSHDPNPTSQTLLAFLIVFVLLFLVSVVLLPICLTQKQKK